MALLDILDCSMDELIEPMAAARLRAALSDASGQIDRRFRALFDRLASADRPDTVDRWLSRSAAPQILRQLADNELTHQALDQLPPASRSSTCAVSWSPSEHCPIAMSR